MDGNDDRLVTCLPVFGSVIIINLEQRQLITMRLNSLFAAAAEQLVFKQTKLFFQIMNFFPGILTLTHQLEK